jgi:oligopeptide transport system permease protein
MAIYAIRRLVAMIPALLGIILITFALMHLAPGGPFDSEKKSPATLAAVERAYHLDDPLWPSFYGEGADTWRMGIGLASIALIVGGATLLYLRRARRGVRLSTVKRATGLRAILTWQLLARLMIVVGAVGAFWWMLMSIQGPVTKLPGSGFVPGQFLNLLWNLSHGDLGPSFYQPLFKVTDIILPAAANSLVLGTAAFLLLVLMAVPLGIIAAVKQNTWIDYLVSAISLVGYSVPNFVLGVVLSLILGLWLGWLPIAGWGAPQYLILPAFVLAIRPMSVLMRLTRASMLEILNQDFIRTARAKGLRGRVVLIRHAMRNCLLPIVTVMGDQFGDLVTGSLVVETLFQVNGIGQKFVESVGQRDYGIIMGTTIFYATLVLSINLLVDLLYGVIDPRVRLGAGARS